MTLCGIGDEAGNALDSQLAATRDLGWTALEARNIQVAGFPKANLHELSEPAFEAAAEQFEAAGVRVYCFGSTLMNWAKRVTDPFDITRAEVARAIPRMQRLGTKYVRIMSFKPDDNETKLPTAVIERVHEVTQRFRDAGLQPVHENCMNHGGMSWEHALRLLEGAPGLEWVFDTANPVFNTDRRGPQPWKRQDPWEFWTRVRDFVTHIHVKDARWNESKNDADYAWPGEGDGAVRRILADAFSRGYDGGISIEPHMLAVFHDLNGTAVPPPDDALRANFVEYGRRLEQLIRDLRPET